MSADKPSSRASALPARNRRPTERIQTHIEDIRQRHERERRLATRRQIAAEVERESQLLEENDNRMFGPASEFVEPILDGDAAENPQRYEADHAQFLLRKAEAYGGNSRQLRIAWADKTNPMTLAQLEDAVNELTSEIPSLAEPSNKGKGKATDFTEDGPNPYPDVSFGQQATVEPQASSQARTQVDPHFSGVPASSGPTHKRGAPGDSQGSSSKKPRAHAYVEPLFPDSPDVPQVATGLQRQLAVDNAHSQGRALSESDGSTILNGKAILYPQNMDPNAFVPVPATCETIPDSPPQQARHVGPSNVKPAGSRPHPKNPPRPTTGLKIAPVVPARNTGSVHSVVPHPPPVSSNVHNTPKALSTPLQQRHATSSQQPGQEERVVSSRQGPDISSQRSAARASAPSRSSKPAPNAQALPVDQMSVASRRPSGAANQHGPHRGSRPTAQGSVVANARSDSHAGHTSINRARVSANASGNQPRPIGQPDAPMVAERGHQAPSNARARGNAAVQPQANARGRANARAEPVGPIAPAVPRPPTPDDIDGELDLADAEDHGAHQPVDPAGSPTDPHHVILFGGKLSLRSFCRITQATVRLFTTRFKAKSLAHGTFDWQEGEAGPWVPSNEAIAAIIWACATRRLNNRFPFLLQHLLYGEALVTTARSNIKRELESLIIEYWKFAEGSPEFNRQLAEDLLPDGFHERDEEDGVVPFGSCFMEKACHRAIFNGPSSLGVLYPCYFNPIPWRFLAFIAALCYQIIHSWRDGEYKKQHLDTQQQQPIFRMYMMLLEETNVNQELTLKQTCGLIHDRGRLKYVSAPERAPQPALPERWARDIQEPYVSRFAVAAPDDGNGEPGQDHPRDRQSDDDEDQRAPSPPRRAGRVPNPVATGRAQHPRVAPKPSPASSSHVRQPAAHRPFTNPDRGLARRVEDRGPNTAGPSGLQRLRGAEEFAAAGSSRHMATRAGSDDLPSPRSIRVAAKLDDTAPAEYLQEDYAQEGAHEQGGAYEDEDMGDGAEMDFDETLKASPDDAEAAEYDDEQERDADDMFD